MKYTALMDSFSYLEPVCCSMSSSNCCFLTCMQISQEAGQVVWYSHLLKNFPQFVVIHTVKGFGVVNKAEVDVFWNSLAFSMINDFTSILIFFSSILIWTLPVLIMYLRKKKSLLQKLVPGLRKRMKRKSFHGSCSSWLHGLSPSTLGWCYWEKLLQKLAGCLTTGKLLFLAQRDIWPL